MKVSPLGAHAHQLTRYGLINCYLVRESDSYTLIDTTLKGAGKQILSAARGIGSEPLSRILLTHAHVDHVGSVDELASEVGKVDLAIMAREARLLQKPPDTSLEPGEPQGKVKGGLPGTVTRPTHLLTEGELFGSLRVLATPGHTAGHASFFDERDGTLYAGDALVCVGGQVHVVGLARGISLCRGLRRGTKLWPCTVPRSCWKRWERTFAAVRVAMGASSKRALPCCARRSNRREKRCGKTSVKGVFCRNPRPCTQCAFLKRIVRP